MIPYTLLGKAETNDISNTLSAAPRNANNKLIVFAGLIVSAIDITNSTSFSAGALIAIIANFL